MNKAPTARYVIGIVVSRRQSRELAVQFVYQWSVDTARIGQKGEVDKFWREQARSDDGNKPYFEALVRGVAEHLPVIDQQIESMLVNWRFERVDRVDLAVLRVAVFELVHMPEVERPDAPVAINEAIEISKTFGTADSPGFVNGVLDALRKKYPVKGQPE